MTATIESRSIDLRKTSDSLEVVSIKMKSVGLARLNRDRDKKKCVLVGFLDMRLMKIASVNIKILSTLW